MYINFYRKEHLFVLLCGTRNIRRIGSCETVHHTRQAAQHVNRNRMGAKRNTGRLSLDGTWGELDGKSQMKLDI